MASHDYLLKFFEEFESPTSDEITERAEKLYQAAGNVMAMYRGHYRDLMQAYQLFIATGCRPYALMGAARVLIAGSYISGGKYENAGLNDAQKYLDQAKAIIPDSLELELQYAYLLVARRDYKALNNALNQLSMHPDIERSFSFAILQLRYWENQKNIPQIELWHKKAMEFAANNTEKLVALNRLASAYMGMGNDVRAVELYQQVVSLDPNDPWAWHNMSIMVMKRKNYSLAGQFNRNAINVMEFGVAFSILDQLVGIWRTTRHTSLVEEVPRYLSHESVEKKERGIFGGFLGNK